MSFIQFESGREKDKMREELREARNDLLKQAEERSKLQDERKVQKLLRGDDQWMLPSVSKKLDANAEQLKTPLKQKKKKKKSRRKSSDSSSSAEVKINKKRKKRFSSESSSKSSNVPSDDEWIEKKSAPVDNKPIEREDWLSGMLIPTFSNKEKDTKTDDRNIASYDPKTNSRELNPFWKDGGDGMPSFQKPKSDSDDDDRGRVKINRRPNASYKSGGWRKRQDHHHLSSRRSNSRERTMKRSNSKDKHVNPFNTRDGSSRRSRSKERSRKLSSSRDGSRKRSSSREKVMRPPRRSKSKTPDHHDNRRTKRCSSERNTGKNCEEFKAPESKLENKNDQQNEASLNRADFLTDQQMNELGAKILKAEILGNDEVAIELKEKLEKAREYRNAHKTEILLRDKAVKLDAAKGEEHVMLTKTNSKGVSKPLSRQSNDSDLWGGRAGRKKGKKAETHSGGERVRYFADDDKYDIKQMFENEKFSSAADQDEQFVNMAGKSKNPNDDLEDIFSDKIRKEISQSEIDEREKTKAIRQHEELKRTLDSCDKCFESPKMEKQLIVSMGNQVYVSLPWHEALQTGHCMIVPMQHVACSTHLDEDVWTEVQDYRKAITRMFQSRKQDVIFFETVRYLNKNPHMVIHCIPNKDFELAPFYFKKAIQESEREWSTNKQLILLKDKDIRRSVPKGLPYFWVHFGMEQGLAHVIEEQDRFPSNFAQVNFRLLLKAMLQMTVRAADGRKIDFDEKLLGTETIGGLLNLDPRLWRRPRKESNPISKVKQFADWWKPFEFDSK